jgi:hypothetical protein
VSKFKAGDRVSHKKTGTVLHVLDAPTAGRPDDYIIRWPPRIDREYYAADDLEHRYERLDNGVDLFMEAL